MTASKKIDSNVTGLRIAYEDTIGHLPASPVWYPLEPNSYPDFGPSIKTTPRNPISQSRQRKKGFVTDLDATGGFNTDLTQNNMTRHLQAFFFANIREHGTTQPMNSAATVITGVDDTTGYGAASGLGIFAVNNLVKASGFGLTANNGLKVVTSASGTGVVAAGLADEAAPPAAAKLEKVGHQFAASDISMTVNGGLARMNSAAVNLTSFDFIPGEWVFLSGDAAGNQFATSKGYARISAIASAYVEFDKTDWEPAVESGAGKSIQIFFGSLLRTEDDPNLIVHRTATMERTLGQDADGTQAEYITGCGANTIAINMPMADKITMDMDYVATDGFTRTGAQGLLSGTRPTELSTDAFNTSSDFSRIKMSLVDPTDANVDPLFAYVTDLTLNISNNVTPNKALGTLGAFETSAGNFTADGKLTAYFSTVPALGAIRNNSDVTIDIVMAKNNAAQIFDLPLISLADGRLKIESDKPIMIPLDAAAAQSKFGHTMVYQNFPYVPSIGQ